MNKPTKMGKNKQTNKQIPPKSQITDKKKIRDNCNEKTQIKQLKKR